MGSSQSVCRVLSVADDIVPDVLDVIVVSPTSVLNLISLLADSAVSTLEVRSRVGPLSDISEQHLTEIYLS